MRIVCALIVLFCLTALAVTGIRRGASGMGVIGKSEKAALYTEQYTVLDYSGCSATAIGPHALLTASHCELPTDMLYLSTQEKPATIVRRIRDSRDHTIYLLKDAAFKTYAQVRVSGLDEVGADVFMIGNPKHWTSIFRKGYIAGEVSDDPPKELGGGPVRHILYSFPIDHGDSGAGVFDTKGRVVGVISTLQFDDDPSQAHVSMGSGVPLAFSKAALTTASEF